MIVVMFIIGFVFGFLLNSTPNPEQIEITYSIDKNDKLCFKNILEY